MKPTTNAGLARQISQTMRSLVRLATANEIKTGQPRKFSSRRERVQAVEIIGKVERIFCL